MARVYATQRRVEFRDTDAAGLMHFSAYFLRMEETEHEFLRSLGLSVWQADPQHGRGDGGGKISWPRVAAQCDYRGAVTFEQVLTIELQVLRLGAKSVTYGFTFRSADQLVAEGKVTAVCCLIRPQQPPKSLAIPDAIRTRLADYLVAPEPTAPAASAD